MKTECFNPERSVFDRWRLYADRLYRNAETRRQFETEYAAWYEGKFAVEPETLGVTMMPIWAVYQMALEDVEKDREVRRRRLNAMLLNLKGRISNLPRRNVGGYLDTQIREVLADIASIEEAA